MRPEMHFFCMGKGHHDPPLSTSIGKSLRDVERDSIPTAVAIAQVPRFTSAAQLGTTIRAKTVAALPALIGRGRGAAEADGRIALAASHSHSLHGVKVRLLHHGLRLVER